MPSVATLRSTLGRYAVGCSLVGWAVLSFAAGETSVWQAELDSLTAKCGELGLPEQAEITRRWVIPRQPGRTYLFRPETPGLLPLKADAPERVKQWYDKFQKLRNERAEVLFAQAKEFVEVGRAESAYPLLFETLRENPDHAEARRVLGYKRLPSGAWSLGAPPGAPVAVMAPLPGLGGAPIKHTLLVSPHFEIHAVPAPPGSPRARVRPEELRDRLEELHAIWQQEFFAYWANPAALQNRLKGGNDSLSRPGGLPTHKVVFYATRAEFLAALGKHEPKIALATGIYLPKLKTAFFYSDEGEKILATYRHEATHQLFQEIVKSTAEPGTEANAWIIEGAALFMESLQRHDGYYTLGGWDADRLQFARYRALAGDFALPLAELILLNREQLQASPDIRKLYSHAAGLTHFLFEGAEGRYRNTTIDYLVAIYRGEDAADTLPKLLKRLAPPTSLAEIDAQYKRFLGVTDSQLAGILAPERLRTLSLGRTTITDNGLAALAKCKNLEWLDLTATAVTDEGLSQVAGCTKTTQLFLDGVKLTDKSLPLIGKLKDLEELDLSNTDITDAGLASLVGLKKLRILYLSGTSITDVGLARLKPLKTLTQLDVERTKTTAAGLADLKRSLPLLER